MSGSFSFCPCSSLARHIRAFFSGLYCVVPPSAAFILALWVNGCAAVAQPDRAQVSAESGGNHDTERDSLPPLALTSQIVFRVLAAEIAVQRNLFAPAYQTYLMLARETHDPRMAQRAAEIALYARSPSDALAAARVWCRDAPHSGRAARLALAQIYLANRQLDDALREFQALHIQSPNWIRDKRICILLCSQPRKTIPRRRCNGSTTSVRPAADMRLASSPARNCSRRAGRLTTLARFWRACKAAIPYPQRSF